jgi:hypothetical protein
METAPYEYDLTNPQSWHNFSAPVLAARIPAELPRVGGKNRRGQPNLRAIWGGKEQVYYEGDEGVMAGWHFKYHLCFTPPRIVGFGYHDTGDGYRYLDSKTKRWATVKLLEAIPVGARWEPILTPADDLKVIPATATVYPMMANEEIGKPRWIIERWREAGDLNGAITESGYYHLLTVQKEPINHMTGMGAYREIDTDILETVKGMYHFMENTTEAQREAMREADALKVKEREAKRKEAEWEDYEEALEKFKYEYRV